jgi:hypothetical protein
MLVQIVSAAMGSIFALSLWGMYQQVRDII